MDPNEAIGSNIVSRGLYEQGVTEALWRLTETGALAIDVGSNIGYMASILAVRAGPLGKVICFEPHPQVFESLSRNVEVWRGDPRCGTIETHQAALGRGDGRAMLYTNDWFQTNHGTAWISDQEESNSNTRKMEVCVQSLDNLLKPAQSVSVMKMDVQGQEMSVLEGMQQLLNRHAVRDIVFEEHADFPAPTHKYLKSKGYSVLGLEEHFSGVKCVFDAQPSFDPETGPIPNYVATLNPNRVISLLSPPVWRSFGPGRMLPHLLR